MKRSVAVLVGFIIICSSLLIWFAVEISGWRIGGSRLVEVELPHAAGLVEQNAVRIAGVQVGSVEHIEVEHDTAVVTARLDETIELHADVSAQVRAKSLLGEKYLELHPGSRDAPLLAKGARITLVRSAFEVDEVLNALEPVLGGDDGSISELAATLNRLLVEMEGTPGSEPIVRRQQLRQLAENTVVTSEIIRRTVETNESRWSEITADIQTIVERVDRISAKMERDLPRWTKRIDDTTARLDSLTSSLDAKDIERLQALVVDIADIVAILHQSLREDQPWQRTLTLLTEIASKTDRVLGRLVEIDASTLRHFLQHEGVKVFVGTKRAATQRSAQVRKKAN